MPSSATSYTPSSSGAPLLYLVPSPKTVTAVPSDAATATSIKEAPEPVAAPPAPYSPTSSPGPATAPDAPSSDGGGPTVSDAITATDKLPTPAVTTPAAASSSSSGITNTQIAGGAAIGVGLLLGIAAIAARRRKRAGKPSPVLPIIAGVALVGGVGLLVASKSSSA